MSAGHEEKNGIFKGKNCRKIWNFTNYPLIFLKRNEKMKD